VQFVKDGNYDHIGIFNALCKKAEKNRTNRLLLSFRRNWIKDPKLEGTYKAMAPMTLEDLKQSERKNSD
jgi:hypothetical protein